MKKIVIPIVFAYSLLISCQKGTSSKSLNPPQRNFAPIVLSLSTNDIVGVDLTNFPIVNLRTGADWKTVSGKIALTITSDGNLKSLGVYDLAFQDISQVSYPGIYAIAVDFMKSDSSGNTYKLTCTPQRNSSSFTFYALAKVTLLQEVEVYLITIDNGAITDSN